MVKELSTVLAPDNPPENFVVCPAENLPDGDARFDLVVCNAVLHFARDEQHFDSMLITFPVINHRYVIIIDNFPMN